MSLVLWLHLSRAHYHHVDSLRKISTLTNEVEEKSNKIDTNRMDYEIELEALQQRLSEDSIDVSVGVVNVVPFSMRFEFTSSFKFPLIKGKIVKIYLFLSSVLATVGSFFNLFSVNFVRFLC